MAIRYNNPRSLTGPNINEMAYGDTGFYISYRLAALQHIPCLHSAFDGYSASLQLQQHRLMSLKLIGFVCCSYFLYNFDIDAYRVLQNLCNILPTQAYN